MPPGEYCNSCDVKIAKDTFEEEAKKHLKERVGKEWEQFGFDSLLRNVLDTFEMKEHPENNTVTAEVYVSVLSSEINRKRRTEDWNRKQKAKRKD